MAELATVRELWRYPVKSMRGERLERARIGAGGVEGDRAWALVDRERHWASAKSDTGPWRLVPGMLDLVAATDEDGVVVTLPGGERARPGDRAADARLSDHLGRPLRFADGSRSAGGPVQAWGRHHDAAPVHAVSDAALAALAAGGGPDPSDAGPAEEAAALDARRLRANVVLEAPRGTPAGFLEDGWVGRTVRLGDATLRVLQTTERCVMTTRAQGDEVAHDRLALRRIGRRNRACAGVYLDVLRPGEVAVGDPLLAVD